jgi:WD40 repeat protein
MFSRQIIITTTLTLAALIFGPSAAAQSVSHLFESKNHYTGPVAHEIASFKDASYVTSLAFSADGKLIATNFSQVTDIRIWHWEPHSSRVIQTVHKPLFTGTADLWNTLRFSSDGRFLASAHGSSAMTGGGSFCRVWNIKSWAVAVDLPAPNVPIQLGSLTFSPDGKTFSVALTRGAERTDGPATGEITIYSTDSWSPVGVIDLASLSPTSLVVSSDGRFAAVGGDILSLNHTLLPTIMIADLRETRVVKTINPFPPQSRIEELGWSADGARLAASGFPFLAGGTLNGSVVRVFDVASGTQISADESSQVYHVDTLTYTRNDKYLIEVGLDNSVRIWDSQQKTMLQSIPVATNAAAVSNDGHYLALADEKRVSVWELK